MAENFLISVVGPTAIGKTALGIKLAQHYNTEIISADSRQFFREMNIGTAVPEEEELAAAKHHFIQHISVEEEYSVGDFEREAIAKLDELFQRKKVVVMVGGSGLYVKSIIEGLDYFPEVDPQIRADLNNESLEDLQQKLANFDPDYYTKVDIENPHRLIRAVEICIGTGKTYSSFLNKKKDPRSFQSIQIGLTAEREKIYDRINFRVDKMMEAGLLEEVSNLFPMRNLNALNTVGYKELFLHLEEKISKEEAVAEIKKNTRRFAKRQLTWFRKDDAIKWFENTTPTEDIISYAEARIKDSLQ